MLVIKGNPRLVCILNDELGDCIAIRPEACICRGMEPGSYNWRMERVRQKRAMKDHPDDG